MKKTLLFTLLIYSFSPFTLFATTIYGYCPESIAIKNVNLPQSITILGVNFLSNGNKEKSDGIYYFNKAISADGTLGEDGFSSCFYGNNRIEYLDLHAPPHALKAHRAGYSNWSKKPDGGGNYICKSLNYSHACSFIKGY